MPTVSYYTKGSLVALALDLTLRSEGASLDAVMLALWKGSSGRPHQPGRHPGGIAAG